VRVIAYQSDMKAFAPDAQLAAVTHHWGAYYTRVAQSVLAGRWTAQPVWAGMKDGLVQLSAVDASLPKELRAQLETRRQAVLAGKLKPFSGRLVDNAGGERLARGTLDDGAIAGMNWLAAGVVGSLPGQ
jgi:simple sugar transport system substrate-binding protein